MRAEPVSGRRTGGRATVPTLRVKICGLRDEEGMEVAVAAGATHVGIVLARSPRQVTADRARDLVAAADGRVETVAVLRNPAVDEALRALETVGADRVQCEPGPGILDALPHGRLLPVLHDHAGIVDEALALADRLGRPGPFVLEAPGRGGRGVSPDRGRAAELAARVDLLLAGGLTPDTVAAAIRAVRPWGVDVSSGVERTRGIKDPELVRAFVRRALEGARGG